MATNKIISIPQWITVGSASPPDSGFGKIYPKTGDNFWYILDSVNTERRLGFDYYFGRGFSSSTLLPSPSNYGYEINLAIGKGLTFSTNSELTVFGLSPSMLSITGSFVAGYVLSTSTHSAEFKWIPQNSPNVYGDAGQLAKFYNSSSLTSSILRDTGYSIEIGEAPILTSPSFSVKGNVNIGEYLYFNDSQTNYLQGQSNGGVVIQTTDEFQVNLFTTSNYQVIGFDYDTSNVKTLGLMGSLIEIGDYTYSNYLSASNLDYVSFGHSGNSFQLRLISGSQGALRIQDGGQASYSLLYSDSQGVAKWGQVYGYNGLTTSQLGIGINLSTRSGLSVVGGSVSIDYTKIVSPLSYTTTGTLSLATVSVTTGVTFGSAAEAVRLSVDSFGRIINISTASIPSVTGPQGLSGPQGFQGRTGPQGRIGVIGLQGLTGPQGRTGVQGSTGPIGNTGIQGSTGPIGNTGMQGNTGPQGNTGSQGRTGAQGPTGWQGNTGPQGNTGFQGRTGSQGPTGWQGLTGPQGDTGPQGPFADLQQFANYTNISSQVYPSGVIPPPLSGELLLQLSSNTMSVGSTQIMYISGTDSNDVYRYDFFEPIYLTNNSLQKNLFRFKGQYNNLFEIDSISYSGSQSNYWTLHTTSLSYDADGVGGVTMSYIIVGRSAGATGAQGSVGPTGTGALSALNLTFSSVTFSSVTHSTGAYPLVQVIDENGYVLIPDNIEHTSINGFRVDFITSSSGTIITSGAGPQGNVGPQGDVGAFGGVTSNFQGNWVTGSVYASEDVVNYGGSTWFAPGVVSDGVPPSPTHSGWTLFSGGALIVGTSAPANSSSIGTKGEIRVVTNGYLYIHTGLQWLRSSMTFSTF